MVRPYAAQFLDKMADYYDIVVFTAGMQDYADWALQHIGKSQSKINYRLYRHHALPCREFYIKDLSMLGRDLAKTIIVDNISESFLL
jgi:CTD small phosphatase-like protein 2